MTQTRASARSELRESLHDAIQQALVLPLVDKSEQKRRSPLPGKIEAILLGLTRSHPKRFLDLLQPTTQATLGRGNARDSAHVSVTDSVRPDHRRQGAKTLFR